MEGREYTRNKKVREEIQESMRVGKDKQFIEKKTRLQKRRHWAECLSFCLHYNKQMTYAAKNEKATLNLSKRTTFDFPAVFIHVVLDVFVGG